VIKNPKPLITNPRILITNDDGIDAPGIKLLQEIAKEISSDIWVVAPSNNQSGAGHRFTLGVELEIEQHEKNIYSMNGTPADCITIAYTHILKDKTPDIILSGINHGQNLGDIIHCSGTMAGAREGALRGALGIGLSQALDYEKGHDISWDCTKEHALNIVKSIIEQHEGNSTYYNVNFPIYEKDRVIDVKITPHQRFSNSPFTYYPSKNAGKFFVAILETPYPMDEGHDFHSLHEEYSITITPLLLQQTDFETLEKMQNKISI
jgi:5'-nucleotidase